MKTEEIAEKTTDQAKADSFKKIKELYYSESLEDKELAKNWLIQMIGEKDAEANLFVLEIYRDMESDENILIDAETYAKMTFKTFPIYFGKNYMYQVLFDVRFKGEIIVDQYREYSRYKVGDGQPKFDMLDWTCKYFRGNGFNIFNDLFK
jgi:hypothetical protein